MSTELVINRGEYSTDSRNRGVVTLTEVLRVPLPLDIDIQGELYKLYDSKDTDFLCYDPDKEYYEMYGNIVLILLDILRKEMPNVDFSKEWVEDGVNSKGIMFNVDDQLYTVEIIH